MLGHVNKVQTLVGSERERQPQKCMDHNNPATGSNQPTTTQHGWYLARGQGRGPGGLQVLCVEFAGSHTAQYGTCVCHPIAAEPRCTDCSVYISIEWKLRVQKDG